MIKSIPIQKRVRQGEVYWCNLGQLDGESDSSLLRKTRPCLIISDNNFNTLTKGALIIPIKTDHTRGEETKYFSKYRISITTEDGQEKPKAVVGDQIRFVSNEYINKYFGTLTNIDKTKDIYNSLFGLTIDETYKDDVCLSYLLGKYSKKELIEIIKNF